MTEIHEHLVSTIIPVFNRPGMLRSAVESVLAQTYRPIEIVISDDGSTDGTPDVAKEFARNFPDEVRYIRNGNQGAGMAREAGRLFARGEFIQYLDSDDLLMPRKFEVQVEALKTHPECGVAYGKTRLVEMGGKVLADPFKWTGRKIPNLFPLLLVDRWWCTHTPLYRGSVCAAVGPWTDLRYSQDWEYDGRVGALGTKLVWCDETVSEHRTHGDLRQTGSGKWLAPKDRVRFFSLMLQHAQKAGVGLDTPEMQHFVRWVFANARQCGAMGEVEAAQGCFDVAMEAAGGVGRDLKAYRVAANLIGWSSTGRVCLWLEGLRMRRSGKNTRKLSWMEQ